MDLVVIGAAGRTGRQVVDRALAAGHRVTAYVRRPGAVTVQHDRLAVVRGDVMDPSGVSDVIAGQDTVVSVLGTRSRLTTTAFSAGIANVVQAMEAKGVRRVIAVSCAALDNGPHVPLLPRLFAEYVVGRILRNIQLDLARMEDELELSDTDWTIIRTTPLTDSPATGAYHAVVGGHLGNPRRLGRADLAAYIMSCISDPVTYRKKVIISQ